MPSFKCDDPDCEYYGIVELIPHVRFIWNDDNKRLEANEAACPKCGNQRPSVKKEGAIVIPWFKAENARNYQNKAVSKKTNQFNY